MNLQQHDTELCNSNVVERLPSEVPRLIVADVGLMSHIPAVSRQLIDVSLEEDINMADDNPLYKHATAGHLEAANDLLSVLSDAVCLRVRYQGAKCHVCLLQQNRTNDRCETEDCGRDLSAECCDSISKDRLDEVTSGNSAVEHEFKVNCSHGSCDVTTQYSDQTANDEVSSSCCGRLAERSECLMSSDASSGEVCSTELASCICNVTSNISSGLVV